MWLAKEKFEVTKDGFRRWLNTFRILQTIAFYGDKRTTEILPMKKTINKLLFEHRNESNKKKIEGLLLLN